MNINLRDMSAEAMIGVSTEWVDPGWELRQKVEDDEVLAPIFRRVEAVHRELLSTNEKRGPKQERIDELTAQMTEYDLHHDRKCRGIHNGLEAAIALAESSEEAEGLSELRDILFPDGLSVTRYSYAEQAGMAQRIKSRLNPIVRTRLAGLVIGRRNVLDEVDDWLDSGLLIARLQAERARQGYVAETGSISKADLRDIRLGWIQAVRAMLNMLSFSELSDEEKNMFTANLREVSAAAVRRRKNQRAADSVESDEVDDSYYEEPIYPNLP